MAAATNLKLELKVIPRDGFAAYLEARRRWLLAEVAWLEAQIETLAGGYPLEVLVEPPHERVTHEVVLSERDLEQIAERVSELMKRRMR